MLRDAGAQGRAGRGQSSIYLGNGRLLVTLRVTLPLAGVGVAVRGCTAGAATRALALARASGTAALAFTLARWRPTHWVHGQHQRLLG